MDTIPQPSHMDVLPVDNYIIDSVMRSHFSAPYAIVFPGNIDCLLPKEFQSGHERKFYIRHKTSSEK
jgi:hypothetical protein